MRPVSNAAEEGVGFDGGGQHAERAVFDGFGGGTCDDQVEQRRHVVLAGRSGLSPSSRAWPEP
jgi:hypothetical protein